MKLAAHALLWLLASPVWGDAGVYLPPEQFVVDAFGGDPPKARALWLDTELRAALGEVLGHSPPMLRVRYWARGVRTAWILEEIGKEKPITAGVVVENGAIEDVKVLVFRESRGWEIRHPFFTRQFRDRRLRSGSELDRPIDGITGATLSVRAMRKMAIAALLLDRHAQKSDVTQE
ncbi:MAG: FMN-binding protein [Gammaproteobacteria bacterium]